MQKEDALKLWGEPTTFANISTLFSRFCVKDLSALPWSDQAPAIETSVISKELAKMNELGFLTINSQPAVDGARSDHKVFGWGPSNGYVYQKVSNFALQESYLYPKPMLSGISRIFCATGFTFPPSDIY
jgi:hypothetical protein